MPKFNKSNKKRLHAANLNLGLVQTVLILICLTTWTRTQL
jgi:hypothetical protein